MQTTPTKCANMLHFRIYHKDRKLRHISTFTLFLKFSVSPEVWTPPYRLLRNSVVKGEKMRLLSETSMQA